MPKARTITSAANPLLKDVRRAAGRGTLAPDGCWVAETFHLLEEALRSRRRVEMVLAGESAQARVEACLGQRPIRVTVLPDSLLRSLAGTETAQGVIALVRPPEWTLEQLFGSAPLVVVLDGVRDPGNAGTIARAAEAFGATGLIFLKGAASPFHPKTLRASAGSLFRVPFVCGLDAAAALGALRRRAERIYAGVPAGRASIPLPQVDLTPACALVIGSEGQGVGEEMRAGSTGVFIPAAGVESLNAAMAATILLYEARRQRAEQP